MKRPWLWPVILILAGLAAYSNTFRVPFIYDDYNAIIENPHIKSLWPPVAPPQSTVAGRPVVSLTLALNYAISGLNPWSYHVFNLGIHIANALLLFGILRRTVKAEQAGWIALLWLAHPLLTESVTYTVQRTELLMALFLLLTLYCVARNWQLGAVVACALGMGCKEVMAVAPVLVLLYDRTFLAGTFREALRQRGKLYALLAATWVILIGAIAGGARDETVHLTSHEISPGLYALTQCGVVLHYLWLAVWPRSLVVDYDDWPIARGVTWEAAVVAGLVAVTVWLVWRRPRWGFLCAWFFLILAPTSSVVPIVSEVAAERRMYLPLIAVVAGLVTSLPRQALMVGLPVLAIGLGALTIQRNYAYRTEESIWRDVVAKRPNNARAYINLATVLARQGNAIEALEHYQVVLSKPDYQAEAHFNLGVTYAGQGDLDKALPHLREARVRAPNSPWPAYNLGHVLAQRGDWAVAERELRAALALHPRYAEAHNILGVVLAKTGRLPEAAQQFRLALAERPDYAEAQKNLALTELVN